MSVLLRGNNDWKLVSERSKELKDKVMVAPLTRWAMNESEKKKSTSGCDFCRLLECVKRGTCVSYSREEIRVAEQSFHRKVQHEDVSGR